MLELYVGCLIVGGGLVGLSFFTDHDSDADLDVDADVDVDVDADVDVSADDVGDLAHVDGADLMWLPLLTLRFWIFFVAFFGLTGTLLTVMAKVGLVDATATTTTLLVALGVGISSGWFTSWLVRKLRSEKVDSNIDPQRDYVGAEGVVLLGVAPSDPGAVRLTVKGVHVDLTAEVDAGDALERGRRVVVLAYEGGVIRVAPLAADAPSAALNAAEPA